MKKIILISLLLALAAHGQQRIAIMGTEDDGEPSIELLALSHLTAKFREVASDILPKNRYGVMTQQSIVDRLGSQEQAVKLCREATCLADLGRKVNADYIAQARIGRFDGNLTIRAELYNVASGNLIASFTSVSKDVQGLLDVLEARAPDLLRKMPGVVEEPPPPPPPPPPPVVEPVVVAEPVYEPVVEGASQEGVRFGVRAGFNVNRFSLGYKDLSESIETSFGFGTGLALNVPIASVMSLNAGLDIYFRNLEAVVSIEEFVASIPILIQFGNSYYFAAGVQLDIPFGTDGYDDLYDISENRSSVDFGVVFGLGYRLADFGFDFKYVYALTGLFNDFSYRDGYGNYIGEYKDKSQLGQYCFGVSYFF